MTMPLGWKLQAFLKQMLKSPEQAQWGFELLLKRPDFAEFFDHLRSFGLFSPANDPHPIPIDNGAYVRVPYWAALDYLDACAKFAAKNDNADLALKVLEVLREVTKARQSNNDNPDNYHTSRKFAEILGHLPLATITDADIDLIPIWLESKFDRGMVAHALDAGLMKRLLGSDTPNSWSQACRVVWHCTATLWIDDDEDKTRKKPILIVDDHWLNELIKHHAAALGSKARKEAADVFLARLCALYGQGDRAKTSWLFRPAVEDHLQNHQWAGVDNRFVEGLRDTVTAWLDVDPTAAIPYVNSLLNHELEIVRRIGIHLVNARWALLHGLYDKFVGSAVFDDGHLHELYGLLRDRFHSLGPDGQAATIDAIRGIHPSEHWKNPERSLKRIQRSWLSAIASQGNELVDAWYGALRSDQSLGALTEHPDFHAYTETSWGEGHAPFLPDELVKFANDGSLIRRLNDFDPPDSWHGPTKRALVSAVEESVVLAPEVLLAAMPRFLGAKRPYQYAIINGFKRLWDSPKDKADKVSWDEVWSSLVYFFEELVRDDAFWTETSVDQSDLTPTRDWIPPLISGFLRTGTTNDDRAYGEELLPRTWQLIQILLQRSPMETEADKDAMTQAINSSKGKAVEAFFSHALRICRLADRKESGGHLNEWAAIKPVLDAELAKCRNSNYEFSTLCAAYSANIEYMDREWLAENVDHLFSVQFRTNFVCAIAGLAFAPAARSINQLLLQRGVFDQALPMELGERSAREKLIQRIALAYLWGDEQLSSSRFNYIFRPDGADDIRKMTIFFWSVHNEGLGSEAIERILQFWRKCIDWSKTLKNPPANVLSDLSRLSVYLRSGDGSEAELLEQVAPYAATDFNTDEFINQLLRLAEVNPQLASRSFAKMLETYNPTYDYEDKMAQLIRVLASKGLIEDAIDLVDRLQHLPGMRELFEELIS